MLILGIETSCDETAVAVYDSKQQRILSSYLFSQVDLHAVYGGVVPEIASRSQLEKIIPITNQALERAGVRMANIDAIAVTNKPGLMGSLLVGVCFAKGLAWAGKKKLIGVNHLEGHTFSPFLRPDGNVADIPFPHLSLTASGGHTAMYVVHGFGQYERIVETEDDAAGEAFDKIAKILGFDYPGGATIERLAAQVGYQDFFNYPRTKNVGGQLFFSFSGIKTAVLYHLVKCGAYDLQTGPIKAGITPELQQQVSSSLLVCITDIFEKNIVLAFKAYPQLQALTFGGGVACNKYMQSRFAALCAAQGKAFFYPPVQFCTDNAGMIAFVGGYKAEQGKFDELTLDAGR